MTEEIYPIGTISNYYGGLNVKESNGSYYWCIENYDGVILSRWEEIPKYLFDALNNFEKERKGG